MARDIILGLFVFGTLAGVLSACAESPELPETNINFGVSADSSVAEYGGTPPNYNHFWGTGSSEITLPEANSYFGKTGYAIVKAGGNEICGISLFGKEDSRTFGDAQREETINRADEAISGMGGILRNPAFSDRLNFRSTRVTEDIATLHEALTKRFGKPYGNTRDGEGFVWLQETPETYAIELGRLNTETSDALSLEIVFDKECTPYRRDDDPEMIAKRQVEAKREADHEADLERIQREGEQMHCKMARESGSKILIEQNCT